MLLVYAVNDQNGVTLRNVAEKLIRWGVRPGDTLYVNFGSGLYLYRVTENYWMQPAQLAESAI